MNTFDELINWYNKTIDDGFKYDHGIDIQPLDNPGWNVSVYLRGTRLKNKPFTAFSKDIGDDDWIECKVENDVFKSYGDPSKLEEIFRVFLEWAEPGHDFDTAERSEIFKWLCQWYSSYCDGDWEHCYGVAIKTLDKKGWLIDIDLTDTDLEDKEFAEVFFKNSAEDWLECRVEGNVFNGRCSLDNLEKTVSVFKEWVESHS